MTVASHTAASASVDRRRAHGIVYTPAPLVDLVLDEALENMDLGDLAGPIIDPACGDGAFLVALVRRLVARFQTQGRLTSRARHRLLDTLRDRMYGVDINPDAVVRARGVALSTLSAGMPGPIPGDLFDDNIVTKDFLLLDGPTPWSTPCDTPPMLVVGNPPYVAVDAVDATQRAALKARFSSLHGRFDLYLLFMEQAARVVAPGGRFAFITPDKWLTAVAASKLRGLLDDGGRLESLTLFNSHRVFPDAAIVPAISVWVRRSLIQSDHHNADPAPEPSRLYVPSPATRVRHATFDNNEVHLGPARELPPQKVLRRPGHRVTREKALEDLCGSIENAGVPLSKFVAYLSAGVATGYNPAFVLSDEDCGEIEDELLHETVRGRDVGSFLVSRTKVRLLVPYLFQANVTVRIRLEKYPLAAAWLDKHRIHLEKRHCVRVWGKEWFDLHDPVAPRLRHIEKIVLPDVARSARFALDPAGSYLPLHSAYYLVPREIDARLLTSLLNSSPMELTLRLRAPRVKDGFSRFRRQFLLPLPIPRISDSLSQEIISAFDAAQFDRAADLAGTAYQVDLDNVRAALLRMNLSDEEIA